MHLREVEIRMLDRIIRIDRDKLADILSIMYGESGREAEDACVDLYNAIFYPGRDKDSGCVTVVAEGDSREYNRSTGWKREEV